MPDNLSRRAFLTLTGIAGVGTVIGLSACSTTKMSDQEKQKAFLAKLRAEKKYKEKKIEVGDNFFSPQEASVEAGTIVIWTNTGHAIHDVMWDETNTKHTSNGHDDSSKTKDDFTSDTLGRGDINVWLFDTPGVFSYYCHYHGGPQRGQWGSITVSESKIQE